MLIARTLSLLLVLITLPLLSGCVGPNAHGPLGGCCGPIALGDGCNSGGCTSCSDACSGCGELYVDPWINNPADCVDPCDTCGNYNGQSCGKCRPMFEGIRSLWGYKCGNDCGCGAEPTCAVSTGGLLGGCKCGVESCDGGCGACYLEPSCGNWRRLRWRMRLCSIVWMRRRVQRQLRSILRMRRRMWIQLRCIWRLRIVRRRWWRRDLLVARRRRIQHGRSTHTSQVSRQLRRVR